MGALTDPHRGCEEKSSRSILAVVGSSGYAGGVTGEGASDPWRPATEVAEPVHAVVVGSAVERYGAGPTASRSRLDLASTAYPGCVRPAVDDLSAGGLVGLDVDLAEWSGWYLVAASRVDGVGQRRCAVPP